MGDGITVTALPPQRLEVTVEQILGNLFGAAAQTTLERESTVVGENGWRADLFVYVVAKPFLRVTVARYRAGREHAFLVAALDGADPHVEQKIAAIEQFYKSATPSWLNNNTLADLLWLPADGEALPSGWGR